MASTCSQAILTVPFGADTKTLGVYYSVTAYLRAHTSHPFSWIMFRYQGGHRIFALMSVLAALSKSRWSFSTGCWCFCCQEQHMDVDTSGVAAGHNKTWCTVAKLEEVEED